MGGAGNLNETNMEIRFAAGPSDFGSFPLPSEGRPSPVRSFDVSRSKTDPAPGKGGLRSLHVAAVTAEEGTPSDGVRGVGAPLHPSVRASPPPTSPHSVPPGDHSLPRLPQGSPVEAPTRPTVALSTNFSNSPVLTPRAAPLPASSPPSFIHDASESPQAMPHPPKLHMPAAGIDVRPKRPLGSARTQASASTAVSKSSARSVQAHRNISPRVAIGLSPAAAAAGSREPREAVPVDLAPALTVTPIAALVQKPQPAAATGAIMSDVQHRPPARQRAAILTELCDVRHAETVRARVHAPVIPVSSGPP